MPNTHDPNYNPDEDDYFGHSDRADLHQAVFINVLVGALQHVENTYASDDVLISRAQRYADQAAADYKPYIPKTKG